MTTPTAPVPRLSMRHVSKTFGKVTVLHDVSLEVAPGEIHGLIGQNGSGKSTLIKLLSGFYEPDAGAVIEIDGKPLRLPVSPHELQERGVAFVHQNLGLDLKANVIENVQIGRFQVGRLSRRIRWRQEAETVSRTLQSLHADTVNPYAIVETLHHAEKASVAIARAIQGIDPGSGVVIFDESTQSLPRDILHEFYAKVRGIAATGTSVVIVSHRLDEVLALCDRVTVLEDGRAKVEGHPTEGLTEASLTHLILGRDADIERLNERGPTSHGHGEVALSVRGLKGPKLRDVDLTLYSGEVVGLIGTSESGYDKLPYVLAGVSPGGRGTVEVPGGTREVGTLTPASAMRLGIGLVPGDRTGQGLANDLSATENLTLPRVTSRSSRFALRNGWQLDEFRSIIERLRVTPPAPDLAIGSYSGGNQQKVLLGKWLLNKPQVLMLHEPTQAVDVGARADILHELRAQANDGVAVLIASIEAQDLANICDRVLVMSEGRIVRELTGTEIEPHVIIDAVYTDTYEKENDHVAA